MKCNIDGWRYGYEFTFYIFPNNSIKEEYLQGTNHKVKWDGSGSVEIQSESDLAGI